MNLVNFLLVEDDPDHAHLIIKELKKVRVVNEINHVDDGEKALQYLRQQGPYADRPRPDIVLLDLRLPRLDGHEVLAAIRKDESLRSLLVVVLTTSAAEVDRAKAYLNHANSYLVKPIDFAQFQQMVSDLSLYWGVWNRGTGSMESQPERS